MERFNRRGRTAALWNGVKYLAVTAGVLGVVAAASGMAVATELSPVATPNPNTVSSPLVVTVEHQGSYQGFYQPPRLSVVLYAFHADPKILWHNARLFELNSAEQPTIDALLHDVTHQLKALTRQQVADKKISVDLMELTRWLEAGHYAKPVPVAIDPSGAWVGRETNPKLRPGNYKLATPNYTSTVQLVGLGGASYQPVAIDKPVWRLLQESSVVNANDVDEVWLVDALEPITSIKVASWNREEVFVGAGSRLFVPLDDALLGDEFKQLNEAIAALLSYRIEE